MSRLGKKLIPINCVMLLVAAFVVLMITVSMLRGSANNLMLDTCRGTLDESMTEQSARLRKTEELWESSGILYKAISTNDFSEMELVWENWNTGANYFAAIADSSGNVLWSAGNYADESKRISNALNGMITNGIVCDNNLVSEYAAPVKSANGSVSGACVLGFDLAETENLDGIKSGTAAEVTLFKGNTRYATTIVGEDGKRAVGTTMSDDVKAAVIDKDGDYSGETNILGKRHYVKYDAMHDVDGKVVGAYFVGFPSSDFDALFSNVVIVCSIVSLAIAIICALIMTYLINRTVLKPIKAVNKIAANMDMGKISETSLDFKFGNDEIGEFAHSIEHSCRTINGYISDISKVIGEMAGGNFSDTSSGEYIGDFAAIKESFEGIHTNLSVIIKNISDSSNNVMEGSAQIADASQILAEGAENQTAAVDELSHAIEDIAEQLRLSTGNAKQANSFSQECGERIEQQSAEIDNMLGAMSDIEKKSNEIMTIIKTIEDIAFQTNILALNAAIEASRAGEAGKGFSVVADEVRNLAAKSAEAAHSTSELIEATIKAVNNGSAIAGETAQTMKQVVDISTNTNTLIAEITSAAERQKQSIDKITDSIGKISDVVQQNSSTAEQTAASCQELSAEAKALQDQIMRLRV